MASETPQWELSKENAAPLRRGRRVATLERSFAAHTHDETRTENERKIREFERLVRPTEVEGYTTVQEDAAGGDDDPLEHWVKYVQFYQNTFPSDTLNEVKLLERCFRAMSKVRMYRNNERFIKICCVFADKSKRPHDIFKYCHDQKIGADLGFAWYSSAFIVHFEVLDVANYIKKLFLQQHTLKIRCRLVEPSVRKRVNLGETLELAGHKKFFKNAINPIS
jgi:hypothetical protein